MKIVFLGVGEACDESLPNNCHIVISKTKLLLDCGYSIPRQLWSYNNDPEFLDGIYISHPHADHYFGLPPYLIRLNQDGRKKPMTIICQRELEEQIKNLLEYGYKDTVQKYGYKINFLEAETDRTVDFNELKLQFAPTVHAVRNLAVKISDGKYNICYSGDGMFIDKTENLYKNADVVIHEAFMFDKKTPHHAIITDLVPMALKNKIKCLALTHIDRNVRKNEMDKIRKFVSGKELKVTIPEPLEEHSLD
jgi:ribonuclease Z